MTVLLGSVAGLLIGSFLNVVVHRVPRAESLIRPPSACPHCGHRIRPWDNVPVLSWLWLRGRCRDCAAPISPRYPVVEAATAALFALVVVRFGLTWELPAFLYLAAIAVALALIDLDSHRLPNVIVLPSYVVGAALLVAAAAAAGQWDDLVRAGIGLAVLWAFYFLLLVVYPPGMGFGDVKLAGLLGMYLGWVGWGALLVGAFAAFLVGGLVSLVLVAARRADRKTAIPFGPWMLTGAALGIGWGEQVWSGYLSVIG